MDIEKRLDKIEARLGDIEGALETKREPETMGPETLELDLVLPEAYLDGLRFNRTEVHAVFEKQENGWYHSRDILFLSARNTEDDNTRDILTEYLNSPVFRLHIGNALRAYGFGDSAVELADNITVCLPKNPDGVKRYNGVDWWYWLADNSLSAATFCVCTHSGYSYFTSASAVGGVAPAFRVVSHTPPASRPFAGRGN